MKKALLNSIRLEETGRTNSKRVRVEEPPASVDVPGLESSGSKWPTVSDGHVNSSPLYSVGPTGLSPPSVAKTLPFLSSMPKEESDSSERQPGSELPPSSPADTKFSSEILISTSPQQYSQPTLAISPKNELSYADALIAAAKASQQNLDRKVLVTEGDIISASGVGRPGSNTPKATDSQQSAGETTPRVQSLASATVTPEERTCRCKRSRCLMLYCECFAGGAVCNGLCGCQNCYNIDSSVERKDAIASLLLRKPAFFSQKRQTRAEKRTAMLTISANSEQPMKPSTCACRKTRCLKKYCECYYTGAFCDGERCRCVSCENHENSEKLKENRSKTHEAKSGKNKRL